MEIIPREELRPTADKLERTANVLIASYGAVIPYEVGLRYDNIMQKVQDLRELDARTAAK